MNEVFASRLKALREESGLSQTELADQLGVSRGSISFYENKSRVPDIDVLQDLCQLFSVSSDYLLGLNDLRSNHSATLIDSFLSKESESVNDGSREKISLFVSRFADLYETASVIDPALIPYILDCLNSVIGSADSLLVSFKDYKHYTLVFHALHDVADQFVNLSDKKMESVLAMSPGIKDTLSEILELASSVPRSTTDIASNFSGEALKRIEDARNAMAVLALHLCSELSVSDEK